jgi:hypothetical protein
LKVVRFGRSIPHLVNALADLDAAGVSFVSLRDNLDLSTPCAFDLLRAEFIRDVLPGELGMVTEDGMTSRQYATGVPQSSCIFEHVYFARRCRRTRARFRRDRCSGLRRTGRPAVPSRPHLQSLRRPHLY